MIHGQSKPSLPRLELTVSSIRDLCKPYLALSDDETAALEAERLVRRATSSLPLTTVSSNASSARKAMASSLASQQHPCRAVSEHRRALPHEPCCRCATSLFEFATKMDRHLSALEVQMDARVAALKRELALARTTTIEWDAVFGQSEGQTPRLVALELADLRRRVADMVKEQEVLKRRETQHKHLIDSLCQQLREAKQGKTRHS